MVNYAINIDIICYISQQVELILSDRFKVIYQSLIDSYGHTMSKAEVSNAVKIGSRSLDYAREKGEFPLSINTGVGKNKKTIWCTYDIALYITNGVDAITILKRKFSSGIKK